MSARPVVGGGILAFALAFAGGGARAEIVHAPPAKPDPARSHLFYLHGAILERTTDPRPPHPRWGVYDFPAILDALAASGAVVVAERRDEVEPSAEAERVTAELRALLAAGVPPERITVVGFSKGGAIAIRVSDRLANPGVRFVLLGACAGWLSGAPELRLHGAVLSIREKSDPIGSTCSELAARPGTTGSFEERVISVGGEHGAFYRPRAEWVEPTLAHASAPAR